MTPVTGGACEAARAIAELPRSGDRFFEAISKGFSGPLTAVRHLAWGKSLGELELASRGRYGLSRIAGSGVAMATFTQSQLEAIADALGDSAVGLTGSEIAHLLATVRITDTDPGLTKRFRLFNAFVHEQNNGKDSARILAFIREAMKPERFARNSGRFEPMRANLNRALAFVGMAVDETGRLSNSDQASTLSEAQRRADELRSDLVRRGVHSDVLRFCRRELLADDYFHAVLEAVKSVADKIRTKTGLLDDGAALTDRAFGGDIPMLAINPLRTDSERGEQRGFHNLVKGTFGMFRNPTAHEPRIHWAMSKEDAEDLLSLVSLIHRRLDKAVMPPRTGATRS